MLSNEPRKLNFDCLDDAVREATMLLQQGYRSVGKWNLAQTLGHCTDWLRFPLDGYPPARFPINIVLKLMRWTIGKSAFQKILRERGFKAGSPTLPETVKPPAAQTDAAALQEFIAVVERFQAFSGQPQASPLFGELSYDQHRELQVIHLQHHLSFLIPLENPADLS